LLTFETFSNKFISQLPLHSKMSKQHGHSSLGCR